MSEDRKNHLDEWSMQAYLDDDLTEGECAVMGAHLEECKICAAAFAELEYLFSAMKLLPEEPLANDLSVRIIRSLSLREEEKSTWYWTLAVQLSIAIIVFITIWQRIPLLLGSRVSPAQVLEPLRHFVDLSAQGNYFLREFLNRIYVQSVATLSMPAIDWPISGLALAVVVGTLVLLWLLGNGFLLQKPSNGPARQG